MKITFYGHSCFGIETGGKHLLFDPFISENELAKGIDISSIPADYIFLSHGHIDHVADAEGIAKNTGAVIVSNFEIVSWYQNKGVQNGHPMNFGGAKTFDFGKVKYVQAVHSSVLPDGSYGGNPGGFIIESDMKTFYYAGDTALFSDMKLFGELNDIDVAFLPIGDNFTMGEEDAARAATYLDCKNIIGMHYNTFGLIEIDKQQAINTFKEMGSELTLMEIGQSLYK